MISFRKRHQQASDSISGKIGATLFGMVFLGMGLLFVGLILSQFIDNIETRTWEKTPCTITRSTVDTVSDGYAFNVEYTYAVSEKTYHGRQLEVGKDRVVKDTISKADALADKYAKGRRTFCYVDPDNPARAALAHGSLWIGLVVLFPMIFVVIGGGIIYGAWHSSPAAPKTYSLSQKASQKKFGKKFQAGFFLIFFIAGAGFGYFFIFPAIIKSLNADDWIKTPCMIRSSRVQTHDGSDSTTYSVDIVYEYSFGGNTYRSGQYKFMGGSSSGYQGKAAVVRQYPAGKTAVCYVNPDNPAEAVLKRELGAEAFLAFIPLIFMIIGLFGVVHSLRDKQKPRTVTNLAGKPVTVDADADARPGPLVLKPKTSRAGKIIASIAISLFWNGIVSVFVYQAFSGWQAGHPDYFLMVFLIPFVAIGLVMIGSIFYFILAAFNPRPVIVLSKTTIRLGDRVPVNWATKGDVYKIQNFKLSLVGEESATYRRGTKTYTDRNTFYEKSIVISHTPESIRRGEAMVQIPAESMHSFKSDNNAITWKITMHCDVPRWPDAKDDFEITVHPLMIEDF